MLKALTESYASARDRNSVSGEVNYYGVLVDIIELHYSIDHKFILFKCDWVDNTRGLIERDDFGFTLINFKRLLYSRQEITDEPFILASQAKQVFYVQDPVEEDWFIVVKTKPRDLFDMFEHQTMQDTTDAELSSERNLGDITISPNDSISWVRQGVPGVEVDAPPEKDTQRGH